MSTKLQITVTKEMLEKSKNCYKDVSYAKTNCAIALAIRDVFPRAEVLTTVIFPDPDVRGMIKLPYEASEFIELFDDAEPEQRCEMDPISFEIDIPDTIINRINIDEIRPLLENHPTLKLVECI